MSANEKILKEARKLSSRELIALLWDKCAEVGKYRPKIKNLRSGPNYNYELAKGIAKIVLERMVPFNSGDKVISKTAGSNPEEIRTVRQVTFYRGRWSLYFIEEDSICLAEDFIFAPELEKEVEEETVS